MELNNVKSAFTFSYELYSHAVENFGRILQLISKFRTIYIDEEARLPYHINIIDELHADENAHSRILAKMLRYQENQRFVFLEKFLNEICNFNLNIEDPIIGKVDSCGRIDIPIFDRTFVVLIENKVTDKARDQNREDGGQIARYIETIRDNYHRRQEEIFIIYTPKYTRQLSEESWQSADGTSYLSDFENRFRSLSYRDIIYPWMKNELLPNIDKTNIYLYTSFEQYIDHLEGLFSLRTINNPMNMKLQEFIKSELGIQDCKPEHAIIALSEKETELTNAIEQIVQLKTIYQKQIVQSQFVDWEKLLQLDFPDLKTVGDHFTLNNGVINVGIEFSIDGLYYVAIIECNNCAKPNIYVGVGRHFVSSKKHEVTPTLEKILNDNHMDDPESFWYGWKFTTLENAYKDLKNLINTIHNLR